MWGKYLIASLVFGVFFGLVMLLGVMFLDRLLYLYAIRDFGPIIALGFLPGLALGIGIVAFTDR